MVVPLGIVSIACISKQRIIKHTEQLQITNIVCLTNYKKLYSSFFTIANLPWASCLISNTYLNGMIKFDFSWYEYNLRWIIKNLLLGKFPNIRFFMWLLFFFRSNIFNLNWFLFHFQFCGFLQTLSYIILNIIYYLALISYDLRISNVLLKQQALPIFHHFHRMMNIVTIRTSRPKFKTDSTSIVYLYSTLFIKKPSSPLLSEALENTKMNQHPFFNFLDSNVTT